MHPLVNKGKWSSEEDQKLTELVTLHQETNWEKIAVELGVIDFEICKNM